MPSTETPTTGYLIWRVAGRWRVAVDRALSPIDVTHAQFAALASLYGLSRTGIRPNQRQLADASGLEPMYVSRLVRTLEQDGLLTRDGDPADPRAVRLALTEHGVTVTEEAVATVRQLQEALLAPLGGAGDQRARDFRAALETLLEAPLPTTPAATTEEG